MIKANLTRKLLRDLLKYGGYELEGDGFDVVLEELDKLEELIKVKDAQIEKLELEVNVLVEEICIERMEQ